MYTLVSIIVGNKIGDDGIAVLVDFVNSVPLRLLNISMYVKYSGDNIITAKGLAVMPNGKFDSLKELYLSNCKVKQVVILLARMESNSSVKHR